jgi:hypothetical protein
MFRPQTVIIRPYDTLSQLVLCTYLDPIMFLTVKIYVSTALLDFDSYVLILVYAFSLTNTSTNIRT